MAWSQCYNVKMDWDKKTLHLLHEDEMDEQRCSSVAHPSNNLKSIWCHNWVCLLVGKVENRMI